MIKTDKTDKADKADKGIKGGSCNRTACQKPDAIYYNHSTRKYYCRACAMMLNKENYREAWDNLGHDLCTLTE